MYGFKKTATASGKRISRVIDLHAPGVWDWEIKTGTFTVTERLREIFGFTASMSVGLDDLRSVTHPDDRGWATSILDPSNRRAALPHSVRYRIYRLDGAMRWISSRIFAHEGPSDDAAVSGYTATVADVTEEMGTADALAQSEQRLRYAIEAGKMAVWEVDLESGHVTQSPELNHLFGYPPDTFMTLEKARACYNPGELERLTMERHTAEAMRARAAAGDFALRGSGTLEAEGDRTQMQAELAITAKTGQPKRLMLRAQYAAWPDGSPKLTGLLFDITETKLAEERSTIVARELQHRVKNSLAVIGALAAQSFRGQSNAEIGLRNFQGRLLALSAANDLILSGKSETASLHDLIGSITRPYHTAATPPFEVSGPATLLQAHAATSIGMVLHELCTNAVKYGALTLPGGVVSIDWTVTGTMLKLTWHERNGPTTSAPTRKGFGLQLLENVIRHDLGGTLSIDFQTTGLICCIEILIDR